MIHHYYNKDFPFVVKPESFTKFTEKELLQYCLGATLYMPGILDIREKMLTKTFNDVTSIVMCLEDAIKEEDLPKAEENIRRHMGFFFHSVAKGKLTIDELPLIFVRVRSVEQFKRFAEKLTKEEAHILSGFVFPKFNSENAHEYLSMLKWTSTRLGELLYGMPILEGREIAYTEKRSQEMLLLRNILKPYKDMILNVRVGGTDMSSLFGVRRGINSTIYDIRTVSNALSDILNFFNRETEYVVSGPVWEYFMANKVDNIDDFIKANFQNALTIRQPVINEAIDGLLREVQLDMTNGFIGKTIIHPTHARFVNAMLTVTREEYEDAVQVLNTSGGVIKSGSGNKMNEVSPHRRWANKMLNRAKAYGVVEDEKAVLDLVLGK